MDRTGIAGLSLCVALIVGWYLFVMPKMREETYRRQEAERNTKERVEPASQTAETPTPQGPEADEGATPRMPGNTSRPQPPVPTGVDLAGDRPELLGGESTVTLTEPERLRAVFSASDAGFEHVLLPRYLQMDSDIPVQLGAGALPWLSLVYGEEARRGGETEVVSSSADELVVERRFAQPAVVLRERWQIDKDRPYVLKYAVTASNEGETPVDLGEFGVACGSMIADGGESSKVGKAGLVELAVAMKPPERRRPYTLNQKKIAKGEGGKLAAARVEPATWVAVHNKYFLLHCERDEGLLQGCTPGILPSAEEEGTDALYTIAGLPKDVLAPGESRELSFHGYAGPKKLKLLKSMGEGLDKLMRLDFFMFFHPQWMGVVTGFVLRSLITLNDFFDSRWGYGYAIMVITFVIKMLFWPLTHASTVSMQRMQAIQPKVKELREQYKDQPQKLQQKTMELYREHKVNPVGGCLPILLQIPMFIALFNTFRSAIELRQASFLWVQDLSLPDTLPFQPFGLPIRPLALFMAASMFLQQMTTPTAADPQQKRMMMFMTAFFLFIFYTMPAGLTLYWSVNQVLTIIQNIVSRRIHQKSGA